MKGVLDFRNRQRKEKINIQELRKVVRSFLEDFASGENSVTQLRIEEYELAIHLVDETEMADLNETWLNHRGSTDVITFDYCEPERPHRLAGEIFVCIPVAIAQSKQFKTSWQSEIVRYVVHGILHLAGYDDRTTRERRDMKRIENRRLRRLSGEFDLRKISAIRSKFD